MKKLSKEFIYLIPGFLIFSYFCYQLNFTQDDAFISYRFVQNFLNGDGLVFNIGEKVEGFTNFGWVMYMIFWGKLSMDYILISKLTGFIFGLGIITLICLIASRLKEFKNNFLLILLAVLITASSQSLAYWAVAGLETTAFAFFALFSIYLYLGKNKLLPFALIIAVLLRPEGAFVAVILVLIELITTRKFPTYALRSAVGAFVLGLPYLAFKLYYYGEILPNSFYAKTGFSMAQFSNGIEYTTRFMTHYGFYGIPLIITLVSYRKLSTEFKAILLFTIIYTLYLVSVGGDVLKVHRFFIPLIGLYALIAAKAVQILLQKLEPKVKQPAIIIVGLILCGLTYYLPNTFIKSYNRLERHFITKMSIMAENIKSQDNSDFSVALPTIGVLVTNLWGIILLICSD